MKVTGGGLHESINKRHGGYFKHKPQSVIRKSGAGKWQYVKRQGGKFWITESMSEDVQLAVLSAREVATKTQSESGQLFYTSYRIGARCCKA
ncbi:hypothetical protein [Treponema phagedenis]|uniref:hypothetical protein n=1 Tax=Treponema phagedenis TaxID=162 RepID=UPI00210B8190|nr:hypothetical protein [Treponema phagedenis]